MKTSDQHTEYKLQGKSSTNQNISPLLYSKKTINVAYTNFLLEIQRRLKISVAYQSSSLNLARALQKLVWPMVKELLFSVVLFHWNLCKWMV